MSRDNQGYVEFIYQLCFQVDFNYYFQHADKAQQAFSADKTPSLHNALPAIKILHASWRNKVEKAKYMPFKEALEAVTQKLNGYFKKNS